MKAPLWFSPSYPYGTPWEAIASKVDSRSGIQYAYILNRAGKTVSVTQGPSAAQAFEIAQLTCNAVNHYLEHNDRVGQFAETIATVKQYQFSSARFYATALCSGGLALLLMFSTFIPATLHETLLSCAGAWAFGIVMACAVELAVRRG